MRLGILSDSHDQLDLVRAAMDQLRSAQAEAIMHCGDITGPEVVELLRGFNSFFTFGNHDADNVPALRRAIAASGGHCLDWGGTVELAGRRIGVVHGHMDIDVRRVLASQPEILLSGHSRYTVDRREGSVRRINPGALHDADECTIALLDLKSDELQFLKVDC